MFSWLETFIKENPTMDMFNKLTTFFQQALETVS